jgi:hypothetical protein
VLLCLNPLDLLSGYATWSQPGFGCPKQAPAGKLVGLGAAKSRLKNPESKSNAAALRLKANRLKAVGLDPVLDSKKDIHERKALMLSLADAFVALPGGMGTLEELSEVLSWAKLGIHDKPCVLYNVGGFYDPFLAFLDQSVECKLVSRSELSFLLTARSVRKTVVSLRSFKADEKRPRWITLGNNGKRGH